MEKERGITIINKGNGVLPCASNCLLTPREVFDKFTEEWANKRIFEYERCSKSKTLAWGYRQGYEEARKDLLNNC